MFQKWRSSRSQKRPTLKEQVSVVRTVDISKINGHFPLYLSIYFFPLLDSVQAFKKRMKLGRFAAKDPEAEARATAKEEQERAEAEAIPIGARCEVTLPGCGARRGTVMFVGNYLVM